MEFFVAILFLAFIVVTILLFSSVSSLRRQVSFLQNRLTQMQNELWFLRQKVGSDNQNQPSQPPQPQRQMPPQQAPQMPPQQPFMQQPPQQFNRPAPAFNQPVYNRPQVANQPAFQPKPNKNGFEEIVGKNILAWCAAILVFIGLICFGVLIYSSLTDTAKIVIMFVISAVLTTVGIVLAKRKQNPFTLTLTGCGLGSLYISVLISYTYFHAFSDVVSFSLLLLWLVGAIAVSKLLESRSISFVAHIGMALSICIAYILGFTDDRIVLILFYQILSYIVLIVGNFITCKKNFSVGIMVSYVLSILASIFMFEHFCSSKTSYDFLSPVVIIAFLLQFIIACALTCIVSFDTAKFKDRDVSLITQSINKFIFIVAVFANVFAPLYKTFDKVLNDACLQMNLCSYICIAILVVSFVISFLLVMAKKLPSGFETISTVFSSIVSALLLIILFALNNLSDKPRAITFVLIVSLTMFALYYFTKNKIYDILGKIYLAAESFFVVFFSYTIIANEYHIALDLALFAVLTAIFVLHYFFISDKKASDLTFVKCVCYILTFASGVAIFANLKNDYSLQLFLVTSNILAILFYAFKYGKNDTAVTSIMHIVENLLISANFFALIAESSGYLLDDTAKFTLNLIVSLTALALSLLRVIEFYNSRSKEILTLISGIKASLMLLAIIAALTRLFDTQFAFSIVCMIIAFICIIIGFTFKIKSIRFYGLIVTLICVLKLAVFDISTEDTIVRILSLIGGGIICFAISAIYSYMNKKLNE